MISVTNIQRHEGVAFDNYLEIEGYSHSFLKYQRFGIVEPKEVTANMRVGSLVDAILTEPGKVDMLDTLYPFAKAIVFELQKKYGDMIRSFKKQVSYTGIMQAGEFVLPVKGRLDFLLENIAVIDLKITFSKDVVGLIKYMGYENQIFGYCKMAGVKKGYIMIYSVPLKRTSIIEIAIGESNEFWMEAILNFGTITKELEVD